MKTILVKVGGSSITVKKDLETLDIDALKWFSKTVANSVHSIYQSKKEEETSVLSNPPDDDPCYSMIIVHGAGSFGHHSAKEYGLRGQQDPPSETDLLAKDRDHFRQLMTGLAKTRHSVKKLNSAVVSHLIDQGINAVGISPCMNVPGLMAHGGDEKGGATILVRAILESLTAGIIPVIHGDAGLYGFVNEKDLNPCKSNISAGILGGDRLVEIIASHEDIRTHIEKVVFLTDVKGVYTKDPKVNASDAVLVREILIDPLTGTINAGDHGDVNASKSTHDHDVTGGLETKLGAAVNVAKLGIPVMITKCCSVSAEQAINCNDDGNNTTFEGTIIKI